MKNSPELFAVAESIDRLRDEIAKITKHLHEWEDGKIGEFNSSIERCIKCGDLRL